VGASPELRITTTSGHPTSGDTAQSPLDMTTGNLRDGDPLNLAAPDHSGASAIPQAGPKRCSRLRA
jgi:hypothetical protein